MARDDYPREEAKPNPLAMEHFSSKLGVKPDEVLYIGDGYVDWMTARNSGTPFIGVTTGHTDLAKWREISGNDTVIIPSIADLKQFL
ncbi:MAG: HAD hydrolase-like protein [Candidatus Methanomethylophilus sp.]|nr:HAD hydrolase-like protein [Methanomethylophilus sp.]